MNPMVKIVSKTRAMILNGFLKDFLNTKNPKRIAKTIEARATGRRYLMGRTERTAKIMQTMLAEIR